MSARALCPGLLALTLIGAGFVLHKYLYYWLSSYICCDSPPSEILRPLYTSFAVSNVLAGGALMLRELWARRIVPLCISLAGAAILSWGVFRMGAVIRCDTLTAALAIVLLTGCVFFAADQIESRRSRSDPQRRQWGAEWFRTGLSLASALVLWYFSSFATYFALDDSFTRVGGTTPYCYARPVLIVYEPLVRTAWSLGWHGGGAPGQGISAVDLMMF